MGNLVRLRISKRGAKGFQIGSIPKKKLVDRMAYSRGRSWKVEKKDEFLYLVLETE
jgi:hypothetical protein